jgi:hypothetical protein
LATIEFEKFFHKKEVNIIFVLLYHNKFHERLILTYIQLQLLKKILMRNNNQLIIQENVNVNSLIIQPLVHTAKKNPIISTFWIAGLLILFFFHGFKLDSEKERIFHVDLNQINFKSLYESEKQYYFAKNNYEGINPF